MKKRLPLILILILGALLRVIALNQSLWLDEAIEWWAVTTFDLRQLLTGYMLGDFNPPGHQALMWFWVRIFGESEMALRMPSVIFGVGTVWWVYKVAREIGREKRDSEKTALTATALTAANGLLIYYSQEARMYAMATFFMTAAMYWFIKEKKEEGGRKKDRDYYLLYFGFMAAAMYSHYLTWLLLPFLAIWGVRFLAPLVFTIPWWPMLFRQLQSGLSAAGNPAWAALSQTSAKNLGLVALKFVTGRIPFPEEWWSQAGVLAIVGLFWAVVGIGVIRIVKGVRNFRDEKMAVVLWAFGPLLLGALIGWLIPIFSYFRFVFVLPAAMILFALGLMGVQKILVRVVVIGVLLFFPIQYLLDSKNHREDWKGAVAAVHQLGGVPVVLIHPAVRPPFDYYDRRRSEILNVPEFVSNERYPHLEWVIGDIDRDGIWYFPYAQPIFDPADGARRTLNRLGLKRRKEMHFRGITVEKWQVTEPLAKN